MGAVSKRWYRLALFAGARGDRAVFSWRVKEALESLGHTVFYFSPRTHPELFVQVAPELLWGESSQAADVPSSPGTRQDGPQPDLKGARRGSRCLVRVAALHAFLERQALDVLLFMDEIRADDPTLCRRWAKAPLISLKPRDLLLPEAALGGKRPLSKEHVLASIASMELVWEEPTDAAFDLCVACPPVPDRGFLRSSLANELICEPSVICLQHASDARRAALEDLRETRPDLPRTMTCFAPGWPEEWTRDRTFTELAYGLKTAALVLLFCTESQKSHDEIDDETAGTKSETRWSIEGERAFEAAVGVAQGASLALVGEPGERSAHAPIDLRPQVTQEGKDSIIAVLEDAVPLSLQERLERLRARRGVAESCEGPLLEDRLDELLEELSDHLPASLRIGGAAQPRRIISIMGYLGKRNFGDEYILSVLEQRIRQRIPGSSVVAISDDPHHTLAARGIYSLRVADKRALDEALSFCSASLVIAGLLFDQGIRWTMGQAELFSDMGGSTIPAITAYLSLAALNGSAPVLYGIGAGPLKLKGAQSLVRFMGLVGARFITRDEDTARLICDCGVPKGQVSARADMAFLALPAPSDACEQWCEEHGLNEGKMRPFIISLRRYENLDDSFPQRVASALGRLGARFPELPLVFCVLDPDDQLIVRRVIDEMEVTSDSLDSLATRARAPLVFDAGDNIEALATLLRRGQGALAMRYHCSLVMMSAGIPCVGLGYLPKVSSLYEEMDCGEFLLGVDASADELFERLEASLVDHRLWADRISARARVLTRRSLEAEEELISLVTSRAPHREGALVKELYPYEQSLATREARQMQYDLAHATDRIQCLEEELDTTRAELVHLRNSHSYRFGHAVMRIPGACKRAFGHQG